VTLDDGVLTAAWDDALLAVELLGVDPVGLGGIVLRSGPGPLRDELCSALRAVLPLDAPSVRMPTHISDDRLLGGLSLAATLRSGTPVVEHGLLSYAHGGILVAAMAERMRTDVAAHVSAVLDRRELSVARDGQSLTQACELSVVALDEGIEDEVVPAPLGDRLAFRVQVPPARPAVARPARVEQVARGRASLPSVVIDDSHIEALCAVASTLGVASLRAFVLAAKAARSHAALCGRDRVADVDATVAARLVLSHRATRIPPPPETEAEGDPEEPPPPSEASPDAEPPQQSGDDREDDHRASNGDSPLEEVVLEAARSGIEPGLLARLDAGRARARGRNPSGRSGALQRSTLGGRPAGTFAATGRHGERINVVETLRAAAPWQVLRRRQRPSSSSSRVLVDVRKEDFRVSRFQQRTETCVIFSVDASGSAALRRLAEAKGAVEQVLADCYVRRDHVALITFRGSGATVVLPPTRSLARARRCLAELAGGGTTPLAAGIDAAFDLAMDARRRGRLPLIVLMTDARGNVPRARGGGANAVDDALSAARAVRAEGIGCLLLDTSPRPRPGARTLGEAMGARYLPLPYLDDKGISRQVSALASEQR
jgi:magnesium chelatase subunit D